MGSSTCSCPFPCSHSCKTGSCGSSLGSWVDKKVTMDHVCGDCPPAPAPSSSAAAPAPPPWRASSSSVWASAIMIILRDSVDDVFLFILRIKEILVARETKVTVHLLRPLPPRPPLPPLLISTFTRFPQSRVPSSSLQASVASRRS